MSNSLIKIWVICLVTLETFVNSLSECQYIRETSLQKVVYEIRPLKTKFNFSLDYFHEDLN